ncbi:MAG TPA: endo-1,4-beta-xylanase [Candidatus Lokiarchaeia archaeon]|nr:endo-1,4-beta-xylanase [Candidatus Lokiarchaeia archaeon]
MIVQRSHSFRFGCNAFQFDLFSTQSLDDEYRSLFSAIFNYATLPFYWPIYEPTPGSYPYDTRLHNMTSWLESFNATAKGHPIIWQDPNIVPSWMASLNQTGQRQAALDRIDTVLARFPEIKTWDLVNEMTHVPNTWLGSTPEATWETALARARTDRPGNTTEFIANEYTIGDNFAPDMFYQFVSNVVADGYAPDALGFQFHTTKEWFPMEQLISTFDDFGAFKIPCHVTEFIPASNGSYTGGIHPGPITEESQATWAVDAYTMLFSLPAVQAITWWDFSSNSWPAWQVNNGGYMMAPDGRVLPVYERLFNLIHVQWNSSTTTNLDANGRLQFTGFYGNYDYRIGNSGPFQHFSIVDNRPIAGRPWRTSDVT